MTRTTFQNTSLSLTVGASVNIDLLAYCPNASSFGIVNTSQAYNANVAGLGLPDGLSLVSNRYIQGTPTTPQVVVCKARAYAGARSPDASWNARSAGAYTTQRFDNATEITNAGNSLCNWDQTIKRSGNGSMRQIIPASSPTDTAAAFFHSTKIPQACNPGPPKQFASNTGFALGEEFYIQYAIRPDRNFVQFFWGNSPKITILDMLPWTSNLNLGPTANEWEHVITPIGGIPYGYQMGRTGPGWNQYRTNTEGDALYQPNIRNTSRVLNGDNPGMASGAGPNWTSLQQQRARNSMLLNGYSLAGVPDGRPDPLSAQAVFAHDQWHTILIHMRMDVGPSSGVVNGAGDYFLSGNHLYEVSMAQEGQDYVKMFSETMQLQVTSPTSPYFDRNSQNVSGVSAQNTCFSGLCFTNLIYQVDMTGFPLRQAWHDEIICSPNPIAAPDFDGTGNYRTADTLLTFKVT